MSKAVTKGSKLTPTTVSPDDYYYSDTDYDYHNQSVDFFQKYGYGLILGLQNFTLLFMILCFIFFTYHFLKKTAGICTVYFYLLFTGLFWGIVSLVWIDLSWMTDYKVLWIEGTNQSFQWYTAQFTAIWTLMLAVNRCTAIVWWQRHGNLWGRHWWKIVGFMLVFPFLINGYSFLNFPCRFKQKACKDANYWNEDANVTGIACVVVAILAVVLSVISTVKYRTQFGRKSNNAANSSTETKLLYQAALSSVTFIGYAGLRIYGQIMRDQPRESFSDVGYWAVQFSMTLPYIFHQLSAFILVFVFSAPVRKRLFSFYKLMWIYKLAGERSSISVVTVAPASNAPSQMYPTRTTHA